VNTYTSLNAFLGTRSERAVPSIRSTRIVRRGQSIAVRYHNTDVVTHYIDGSFIVASGGYRTSTTKARINDFSSARVHQKRGAWFLTTPAGEQLDFTDGMPIAPASHREEVA
jgi:hypothetical protein